MAERESLQDLERWHGGFPAAHEFSTLGTLEGFSEHGELSLLYGAANKLREHWDGQFAGLYLYGPPGTGKTHAAVALARELHNEKGANVHYQFAPDALTADSSPDQSGKFTSHWIRGRSENVFPRRKETQAPNILVLDDVRLYYQKSMAAATEAAAQNGGLIIATSNYNDPFAMLQPQNVEPETQEQALIEEFLRRENPEIIDKLASNRREEAEGVSDALRSRVAAGFRFIEFGGPDRRKSFWQD